LERLITLISKPFTQSLVIFADWLADQNFQEDAADNILRYALTISDSELGNAPLETAAAKIALANLLTKHQNISEEAESLYNNAVVIVESEFGEKTIGTLPAINALGFYYLGCGRFDVSSLVFERAVSIVEEACGWDHPDTLLALKNLAWSFEIADKYELAVPLYQRALSGYVYSLGAEHLDTIHVLERILENKNSQFLFERSAEEVL
jgi:tetratricopeptide (TPR) repeat protein